MPQKYGDGRRWKDLSKLQVQYLKQILGVDVSTPTYVVREETKVDKIRVEAGRRAAKYEESEQDNTEMLEGSGQKKRQGNVRNAAEILAQIGRVRQKQEQYDRIVNGRYNKSYQELREEGQAEYLKKGYRG